MSTPCWNFGPNWLTPFKNGNFQSIFARSASALLPSKKSSIITNRKSTVCFPMSLRWRAYIASEPNGAKKCKVPIFHTKVDFSWRKPATKFLCVKTLSGRVVRHSLACLTMHKYFVVDVPFYPKFWVIVTHLLQKMVTSNRCSAWTITSSKQSSVITNRKSTVGFPMSLRWTVYVVTSSYPL